MTEFKMSLRSPYGNPDALKEEHRRLQLIHDTAESIKIMYPAFSTEQCMGIAVNAYVESKAVVVGSEKRE